MAELVHFGWYSLFNLNARWKVNILSPKEQNFWNVHFEFETSTRFHFKYIVWVVLQKVLKNMPLRHLNERNEVGENGCTLSMSDSCFCIDFNPFIFDWDNDQQMKLNTILLFFSHLRFHWNGKSNVFVLRLHWNCQVLKRLELLLLQWPLPFHEASQVLGLVTIG